MCRPWEQWTHTPCCPRGFNICATMVLCRLSLSLSHTHTHTFSLTPSLNLTFSLSVCMYVCVYAIMLFI